MRWTMMRFAAACASMVCSLLSRKFLATCWVMVEAPTIWPWPVNLDLHIADAGCGNAAPVEAAMGVEGLVLGRDIGLDQALRHRS